MVLLEVSAQTRAFLLSLDQKDAAGPSQLPDVIDHSVIVAVLRRLQASQDDNDKATSRPPSLDSLLRGSKLHHAAPRASSYVRPPELDARLAQIRRQNEEDEYRRMLSHDGGGAAPHSSSSSRSLFNESDDWRETSSHLSALLNILFSCVGVVCALWFCCAQIGAAVEVRVLLCMLGGTVVVAAEAWLYSRHFEREKRREERRRREGFGLMAGGMGVSGARKKEKQKDR